MMEAKIKNWDDQHELTHWDDKYMELAGHIALWSKDQSTKVGCVIVSPHNRVINTGINGFPSGINDQEAGRHERPTKYLFTEHAERNAIYSAAKHGISLNGGTMYLPWFPCADCARAIIQSGIKRLFCKMPDTKEQGKWTDHFRAAMAMLQEAGIEVIHMNK